MIQEVVDLLINQKSRQRPILSHFKAKFQFMSQLLGFWGFGVLGFWGFGFRVWGLGDRAVSGFGCRVSI